jgi:hypothetical protein
MPKTRFQYTVSVEETGAVSIDPKIPEDLKDSIEREATVVDIIDASRKLIADLERQMIFDGMNSTVSTILGALLPEEPATVPETVKGALKERGITPAE